MSEPNAYIVQPKRGLMHKTFKYSIGKEIDFLEPLSELYVPASFVIGPLKKEDGLYRVNERKLFYRDQKSFLSEYQAALDENLQEIVAELCIPKDGMAFLKAKGREYKEAHYNLLRATNDSLETFLENN